MFEELPDCFPKCLHYFTFPFSLFFKKRLLEAKKSLPVLPRGLFLVVVKSVLGENPEGVETAVIYGAYNLVA